MKIQRNHRGFNLLQAALSLFLCICGAGCGGLLKQPPVAKAYFAIDPGRPQMPSAADPTTRPEPEVLRVRMLRVSPPYDGVAFVYRIGPSQFDTDYYNNFIAPPASLLTGSLIDWLARSEPMTICDASSDLRSDLILEGTISRLYIDSTTTPSPTAVVAGRFFLTRDRQGIVELLSDKTYEGSAAVSDRSPAGFASAWGQAYRKLLEQLGADLQKHPVQAMTRK